MNTLKFGNGEWYGKKDTILAYNDENSNFKPLPFSFDRASSATRINKEGLIETVGSGEPRIDYKDDSKGALLLEPSRSNLIPYSEDFSNSSWNVFRGSVTADVIISPDGTQNASRYQEDSQTGSHLFRRQSLSITNGLSYTGSIFIKKGELTSITLQSNSSSRWVASATFDVENGLVTSGTGVIEDYGNGWYRCSISGNAVQTTTVAGLEMYTSVGAGRDGDGLYMYGAMFEQGSYATSIIPTQGSIGTRVADVCNNGANEQVINSTEGVLYFEGSAIANDGTFKRISVGTSDNLFANSIQLRYNTADNSISYQFRVGNVYQADITTTINSTNINKIACVWETNRFEIWINGIKKAEDTSGSVPPSNTFNSLFFGKSSIGLVEPFKGNVKDLKIYNTALTDQELINLTTI